MSLLKKALKKAHYHWIYYRNLALLLLILSWGLYAAIPRFSFAIQAVVLSLGIAYYPLRHYLQFKRIEADIRSGGWEEIETFIYAKKQSNINRLQASYYLYTHEQTFEVEAALFLALKEPTKVRIRYASRSKVILHLERMEEDTTNHPS